MQSTNILEEFDFKHNFIMAINKLLPEQLFKDPLFWNVLLLNLLIVYLYADDAVYNYNIVFAQALQTFAYGISHYFLLKDTPIKYIVKKVRLNRTRKKTDKNRKSFGTYVERDEKGNTTYAFIFLILLCFITLFLVAIVFFINWKIHEGSLVFQISDFYTSVWAISNAFFYYKNNKKRLTYSNKNSSELIAIPFFKLYIPIFLMFSGYILMMKVVGDLVSFILSNPKYWKTENVTKNESG